MTHRIVPACAGLLLAAFSLPRASAAAPLKTEARSGEVSPHSGYVTIRLDGYARDLLPADFSSNAAARQITANGIPFDLVEATGANHVFLKDADWPDWETDPSAYYAAYDSRPKERNPRRKVFSLPTADYSAAYLLATCDDDTNLSPVVTFRIGAMGGGHGQVLYHDFQGTVPRLSDKPGATPFLATPRGNLYLVRIPLGRAISQDFPGRLAMDLDITKELRLAVHRPDPCRFNIRPLGLPSGVRIFGLTFQLAPVRMAVTSEEPGHIFNEPAAATFQVTLSPLEGQTLRAASLEALARDSYGRETSVVVTNLPDARLGETASIPLTIPVASRGYFELAVSLKSGRNTLLTRTTSFAMLPPDTRKFRSESPFGVWDFSGGHFTPRDPDLLDPLYVKAGLRYGMFHAPEAARRKYGILKGTEAKLTPEGVTNLAAQLKADSSLPPPERLMIFHETSISGPHITRVPDFFTGRGPYAFSEKEQATFTNLWATAEATARAIRAHFPKTEIYFGNGTPLLLEEFLRHQFPKDLLGSRGNEAGTFMRMPETQPTDFIANNAGLWMDRMLLDGYGYPDTPLRQCYEMCYPNTNPGNLSPETQARYLVRHLLHSLAWRIPIIRAALIVDTGNSYQFSNWGASGICYAMPDVRPKPSYVALATLTLKLDGAAFTRSIPVSSPVVYAFEFKKKDGSFVTCLWTLRGTRVLQVPAAKGATLTDLMGTETRLEGGELTVSANPVFLDTPVAIPAIAPGMAVLEGRPTNRAFRVSSLGALTEWTIETNANYELETYNPLTPRRKGDFRYAEIPAFEGETQVLAVTPNLPTPGKEYLPMYSVLRHNEGVEIPGAPTQIGLMVNGNGGWGRVIFELTDASGQRWISLGAEESGEPTRWLADLLGPEEFKNLKGSNRADWNTDDAWQRSCVNFEGWHYLRFPLPGNYPGEGYHWPCSSQWRFTGDGRVHYPLTLTRLAITLPEKVLKGTEYAPVPRPEIYLKDLMVTYDPPDVAFAAE